MRHEEARRQQSIRRQKTKRRRTVAHHPQTFSKSYSTETTPATAKIFRRRSSGLSVAGISAVRSNPSTNPDVATPREVFVLVLTLKRERGDGDRDFERVRPFARLRFRRVEEDKPFFGALDFPLWKAFEFANIFLRCSLASFETDGGIVPYSRTCESC